jgi:hypothetical protein
VVKRVTGTGATQAVVLLATDLVGGGGSLVDGDISVTAIATDRAGNTSLVSGESVFKLDTLNPNPPTLTLGANVSDGATAEEAKQTSGVVLVSGEVGSTIEVTFKDKDNHSVVKRVMGTGANQAVVLEATDLIGGGGLLVDGDISVRAIATDPAGNRSVASGESVFKLDTLKPNTPTLTLGANVSDGATAEEAKQTTGVVLVNGEVGSTIEVTFKDKDNHSVVKRVMGTGANQAIALAAADLSASGGPLVDGDISVTATSTDSAGNKSVTSGVSTFSLDTSKPTATFTTPADGNQGAGVAGDLVLTFNETVRGKGTGNIKIYKLIDDSAPVSTIDASNANITGTGVNTRVLVATTDCKLTRVTTL